MGNLETYKADRERARTWVKGMALDQVHAFVDANVLGDFEWREWMDTRPSGAFLNAAFDEAQHREETEATY